MIGLAMVGIATLAVLAMGCSGGKDKAADKKQDAAPSQKPKPECRGFPKNESYYMVSEQSYDTAHFISNGNVSSLHLTNWHGEACTYLAAESHMAKTTCDDASIDSGKVSILKKAMVECFGEHYAERADPKESAFLALIHCLGTGKMDDTDFEIANKAMSDYNQTQVDWGQVKLAFHHFDKATEEASSRFTKPSARGMSGKEKVAARAELAKAQALIEPYRKMLEQCNDEGKCEEINGKLTHYQQRLLREFIGFLDSFGATLGTGGRPRPISTGGSGGSGGSASNTGTGGSGGTKSPFPLGTNPVPGR